MASSFSLPYEEMKYTEEYETINGKLSAIIAEAICERKLSLSELKTLFPNFPRPYLRSLIRYVL